jgi:hypothetical protein
MKRIPTYEQFVNEKVYRLSGFYSQKGFLGKIFQTFKKQVERVSYEGDVEGTLEDVNKIWDKFQDDAKKMILAQVEKAVKDMDNVLFVTMSPSKWIADEVNGLNQDGGKELYISLEDGDFVINVGFMDDVDASKYKRKFDKEAYNNTPMASDEDVIYGTYDSNVGDNNLELRGGEVMSIDAK